MKKIVLRNLPPEIQRAIKRKALNEDLSREEAVVELLRDTEIQRRPFAVTSVRSAAERASLTGLIAQARQSAE